MTGHETRRPRRKITRMGAALARYALFAAVSAAAMGLLPCSGEYRILPQSPGLAGLPGDLSAALIFPALTLAGAALAMPSALCGPILSVLCCLRGASHAGVGASVPGPDAASGRRGPLSRPRRSDRTVFPRGSRAGARGKRRRIADRRLSPRVSRLLGCSPAAHGGGRLPLLNHHARKEVYHAGLQRKQTERTSEP